MVRKRWDSDMSAEKTLKEQIATLKERDKCEECFWNNNTSWCSSCRLSDDEGNLYFFPNLFSKKNKQT